MLFLCPVPGLVHENERTVYKYYDPCAILVNSLHQHLATETSLNLDYTVDSQSLIEICFGIWYLKNTKIAFLAYVVLFYLTYFQN